MIQPFHLAIPVHNIATCRQFYGEVLGLEEGRSDAHWVDYNFYGHQLVIHLKKGHEEAAAHNPVDGKSVPVPHFGVVLTMDQFQALAHKVRASGIPFIIEPYIRFEGEIGEQATMFFKDPSGNALEFKAFKNIDQLFAK